MVKKRMGTSMDDVCTRFELACQNGDLAGVESFLAHDLVADNWWEMLLDSTALRSGHLKIVERLLQDQRFEFEQIFRAICDDDSYYSGTPVSMETLLLLIQDHRFDPTVRLDDQGNKNALEIAAYNGNIALLELLLKDPRAASVSIAGIVMAGIEGLCELNTDDISDENVAKFIVKLMQDRERFDPNNLSSAGYSLLAYACWDNKMLSIVNILLQDPRVDPNYGGTYVPAEFPLLRACPDNYGVSIEIVRRLLQHPRIEPSLMDNEVLRGICENYGNFGEGRFIEEDGRSTALNDQMMAIKLLLGHPKMNKKNLQGPAFALAREALADSRSRLRYIFRVDLPEAVLLHVISFTDEPFNNELELLQLKAFYARIRIKTQRAL